MDVKYKKPTIKFCQLNPGDTFTYLSIDYMKIVEISTEDRDINAVGLMSGLPAAFDQLIEVQKLNGYLQEI